MKIVKHLFKTCYFPNCYLEMIIILQTPNVVKHADDWPARQRPPH